MRVIAAVPYRDIGCRWRRAAWRQVEQHLSVWPVFTFDDGGELFSRAGSLNLAFENTDADVVIACDADLLVSLEALSEAVMMAVQAPGLVQPFDELHYLDHDGRVRWVWSVAPTTPLLGGCNVLSRETWERSGGWDAGFRGWCGEDVVFAAACARIASLRRLRATATHLYHPKLGRYVADDVVDANGERMRRILAEGVG